MLIRIILWDRRKYGLSAIAGLARLNGYPTIVLNNPQVYGGGWTCSSKIIKIIDLNFSFSCTQFVDNLI